MKKLMIFVDWFLPGYKAGGQIRSCTNLALALRQNFDIYVVTTDRDLGDTSQYQDIQADQWKQLATGLRVMYLSPGNRGLRAFSTIIREVQPHTIYLNSMFSVGFTLVPVLVCRFKHLAIKVVLAPRGMLHQGAIQYKRIKKSIFFHVFRAMRLQQRITFHATDEIEAADIRRIFGQNTSTKTVNDYPDSKQAALQPREKKHGELRLLFVSRISPKKNLDFLLSLLPRLQGSIMVTVAGPVEDEVYWKQCLENVSAFPSNIRATYLGAVPNDELPAIYQGHHLFVLPTHGENFGHVIFESLVNGRPVLISDLTPWKGLEERQAGWSISLSDREKFVNSLQVATDWDQQVFDLHCRNAWTFAKDYLDGTHLKNSYLELLG